jgi:tetratricopeptide (TPR) repeat protein/predicted phosphodiesterase
VSVTWLHISDFHIRSGDPYDRDAVLRALVKAVADYRARGRAPDVIFATGDIAHSGKAQEYEIAERFFDDLLSAAKLNKSHLFVIPGNHDVDRDLGVGLARTLNSREQSDSYFRPGIPKPHLTQKLRTFLDWHNKYFAGIRTAPETSTCGPVELLTLNGLRLGILPMNSALFCEGDDDHDKLWIGRRCIDSALSELRKIDAEVNIILVHHPLEWLNATEGSNIQAELETSGHILLRGHLHETRVESVASAEGEILRCAAGAAYQSRKWPNRALYGTLENGCLTIYPIRYEDSPKEIWTTDPSVFPREEKHSRKFEIHTLANSKVEPQTPQQTRRAAQPSFRSNIGSRGNLPFVGREDLLQQIANTLRDPTRESVVVLDGPPGVGKSEVAREFARLHRDRYSGGTFLVDASTDAIAINLANIGKTILDLRFSPDLPLNDQGQQTFNALGAAPTLLIYDNVQAFDHVLTWLPLSGMPCHVLITTLADDPALTWPLVEVKPLSHDQSLELVEKLTGGHLPSRFTEAVAKHAGGLPVQIIADATTLAYEQRRGRLRSDPLTVVAAAAKNSFQAAYDRLERPARLLLHTAAFLNPQHIAMRELSQHLTEGLDWSETDVKRTLDICLDLHLLDGTPDPTMHQLFASFLRETLPSPEEQAALARVRPVQGQRFVELARAVSTSPADTQSAAALLNYPLTPKAWIRAGDPLPKNQGATVGSALLEMGRFEEAQLWFERNIAEIEKPDEHGRIDHEGLSSSVQAVGICLSSAGKYEEARPWFERAVAEKEKGDEHGRIDHTSLGKSVHAVGNCLASTGQYEEARSWFRRAAAEKEKGDVHGRINHESLSSSVHAVGNCLSSAGKYEEARPWFERAVAEAEKGDVHGRVDHAGLANSLHQVGYCLSSVGQYEEARPWFKRAIAEAEKGDVHGRVDHESLGKSVQSVGYCLSSAGQYEEAGPWFERAIAEAEKGDVHGRIDHESLGRSAQSVGYCLSCIGQSKEATSWYERAVAEKEKGDVHGRIDHESLSSSVHAVGICLSSAGQYEEARPWFERAVSEAKQGDIYGRVNHEGIGDSLHQVGYCLSSAG